MKLHLFFGLILFSSICFDAYGQLVDSVERKRKEYENIRSSSFGLLPHRQMYLMPYSYNWMPHNDLYESLSQNTQENKGDMYRNAEAEFQISFAISIIKDIAKKDWDIMGAYTHNSYWQVYNAGWSRPFRETNYMPELFSRYMYKHPKEFFGINLHGIDAGYVHQSNGQVHEISRSWDRFFVRGLFEFKGLYAQVSLWNRIPEERELDDNRDILDYMGYGEIELTKKFEKHTFHLRTPLLVKYLGYDIKYSHPLNEGIRWFINFRSGYGHSLIEYNRQTQRLGAGVMLDNVLY